MNINDYQKEYASAIKNRRNHPIISDSYTSRQLIILDSTNAISAEAGELANVGKKIYRFKQHHFKPEQYSKITEEHLKEEFADVLSNCFDMACRMGWSVEEILLDKLKEKRNGKG